MEKMKKVSICITDIKYDYACNYIPCLVVKETPIHREENRPYLETRIECTGILKEYNPNYGDNKLCKCGHPYHRHFDSYSEMLPIGCKYCGCDEFIPAEVEENE